MRSFSFRLNTVIISIMVGTLLGLGIFVGNLLEKVYFETVTSRLTQESALIATFIDNHHPMDSAELQPMVIRFAKAEDSRITIISMDGTVLADSEVDPRTMENHLNRPEISEALHNAEGTAIRLSSTLGQRMVYVAHVFGNLDGEGGVVRVALPVSSINEFIHQLWISLTLGMVAALIINIFVSLFVSRHITRPLQEITEVARKITERKYETRVLGKNVGGIEQLAKAINFMAASLQSQMYEIKVNEEKLSGVLKNMFSGVILISESRRILLANAAAQELLGYSEKTLIGKLHIEAGLNYGLSEIINRCFRTGERIREEVHIYYPEERIVDCNLAPYTSENGEVKGVVTVLHDITAIRRLEKIRSEFVANVSHELKTPITSIKGFAETLLDGAMDDPQVLRNFLEIIYNESERLHRLVNDLLDLSKVEQRKVPLKIEEVHLYDLICDIYQHLQEKVNRKRIEFHFPSHHDITIDGDKDRLHQILVNLIDNAISYTSEGGTVSVEVTDHGNEVELTVADTGIGIPRRDRERIFERFYRVDKGRSRESGGTGLGLAIVKHLVDAHHGQIMVESEEGKGSRFRVFFPKNTNDLSPR